MQSEGVLAKAIRRLAVFILRISDGIENIKGHTPEIVTLVMYFLGHMLMLIAHEPWFDEALAWLIARDSSFYEILFTAPHYEGHPSLWHLVLLPFARLGVPYELSLSLVSLFFSGIAIALFIFKSPFKRIIRVLLPFSYFIFYQYSVISRPYCMMMLAFTLVALTYPNRTKRPGRFILSLWFLCMTSAYGIVIAGGICIAWFLEMLKRAHKQSQNKNTGNGEYRHTVRIFFEDYLLPKKIIIWLLALFGYAIFIIIRIMPANNAYAIVKGAEESQNGLLVRLLYSFFGIISDSFFTNVFYENGIFRNATISTIELIVAVIIGSIVLILILYYSYRRRLVLEFIIPYALLGGFTSIVYLSSTHIGVAFMFIVFWLWVLKTTTPKESGSTSGANNNILQNSLVLFKSLSVFILLYWSISSCICDCFYEYGYGRNESAFLKKYGLENSIILPEWTNISKEDYGNRLQYDENVLFMSGEGISIAPYLEKMDSVINPARYGYTYANTHELFTKQEMETILNENGKGKTLSDIPEVLLGMPDIDFLYDANIISLADYVKVYESRYSVIVKGIPGVDVSYIYVKKEVAEKLGIDQIRNEVKASDLMVR